MKRLIANAKCRYDFAVVYVLPLLTAQRAEHFV